MNNVYFIHGFSRKLISVSRLFEQLFNASFNNNEIVIFRNNLDICNTKLENGLYILRPNEPTLLNAEIFRIKHPKSKK